MAVGARIAYQIGWHFVRLNWISEIIDWQPNQSFIDVQVRGPYAKWHHTHTFHELNGGTQVCDRVQYELPLGIVAWVDKMAALCKPDQVYWCNGSRRRIQPAVRRNGRQRHVHQVEQCKAPECRR